MPGRGRKRRDRNLRRRSPAEPRPGDGPGAGPDRQPDRGLPPLRRAPDRRQARALPCASTPAAGIPRRTGWPLPRAGLPR
jgi:hypothetical protein